MWDISPAQWFIHRSYRPNCFDSTHLSRGKMIPLWAETLVADILCWSKWCSHVCAAFLQVEMLYVMIYVSVTLVEQFRFVFNYSFSTVKIHQCNYLNYDSCAMLALYVSIKFLLTYLLSKTKMYDHLNTGILYLDGVSWCIDTEAKMDDTWQTTFSNAFFLWLKMLQFD